MIKMWSFIHIMFILSPWLILAVLFLLLRKKSEKTKYIVGVVIGCLSFVVIMARMISYFVDYGFRPHALPIQLCHIGNIVVFVALVFKSKIATAAAWCLHLFPAVFSIVWAEVLESYTFFYFRAQCFMWGHALIVIGTIYPILMKLVRIDWKSLVYSYVYAVVLLIVSVILNSVFNNIYDYSVNYFNAWSPVGFPLFSVFYDYMNNVMYGGWLQINWLYILGMFGAECARMALFYFIQRLFYIRNNNYKTYNIFQERKIKYSKTTIQEASD